MKTDTAVAYVRYIATGYYPLAWRMYDSSYDPLKELSNKQLAQLDKVAKSLKGDQFDEAKALAAINKL